MNSIIIQNINNYTQTIRDGNLVLSLNSDSLSENQFSKINFLSSKIIYCRVNDDFLNKNNYTQLLVLLYSKININEIFEYTTLNLNTNLLRDKGFIYYDKLGFSIQGQNSNLIIKECLNVIKRNGFLIEIKIQLKNNQIINYNNFYNL